MQSKVTLTIDIGNTSVGLAVFRGAKLCCTYRLSPDLKKLSVVLAAIQQSYKALNSVVICSVAPKILKRVETAVRKTIKINPRVIGKNIKVPVKSHYNKKQIGQDRLVCAYAATSFYKAPIIIIDLGTAITCDYVSKKGEYEGGIIIPGLRLSAESLFKKTALLPNVHIERPEKLIGRDTKTSILSGIFYGYGALLDGLIARIHHSKKNRVKVILTGGYAPLMKKYMTRKVYRVDEALVFKGLALLSL